MKTLLLWKPNIGNEIIIIAKITLIPTIKQHWLWSSYNKIFAFKIANVSMKWIVTVASVTWKSVILTHTYSHHLVDASSIFHTLQLRLRVGFQCSNFFDISTPTLEARWNVIINLITSMNRLWNIIRIYYCKHLCENIIININ